VRSSIHLRSAVAVGLSSVIAAAAVAAPASAVKPPITLPATAKKPRKPTHVSCTVNLWAIIRQPAPTAANFGTTRCSHGFGLGVQQDSSTTTRTSLTTGSFTGPFKMFFDQGTIYGTFTIGFVTTLAPPAPPATLPTIAGVAYRGTLKVTRGSGRYAHARGGGTLTGSSPDAVQTRLDEHLMLTGL
jgi:hypothetical protein